jgi:CheY-like chemotaxis protein
MNAPPLPKATVLYVDDEETDVFFMRTAFRKEGLDHLLRVVGNGREALDYLAGRAAYADRERHPPPSVVLLDLNLPLVSGFDVLKWLRDHPELKDVPVVVFSSSSRNEDKAKARELGANEYVEKPTSGLLFREVVRGLRERWLAEQPENDQEYRNGK